MNAKDIEIHNSRRILYDPLDIYDMKTTNIWSCACNGFTNDVYLAITRNYLAFKTILMQWSPSEVSIYLLKPHRFHIAGLGFRPLLSLQPSLWGVRWGLVQTRLRVSLPSCGWGRRYIWKHKTMLRPSYLHNHISYTGKTTSLYWIIVWLCGFWWERA